MRAVLFFALLIIAAACGRSLLEGGGSGRRFGAPTTIAQVSDARVRESSGLAPSLLYQGQLYTHNDSGDRPRLFRFDLQGKVQAELAIAGAKSVDWEDMASAEIGGRPYLYIGDIGDNSGRRDSIRVYRLVEKKGTRLSVDATFTLKYEDEPHNAEALLVHPTTGDLYVVTKAGTRAALVFKAARPDRTGTYTLKRIGQIQVGGAIPESRRVTGGAISPDGRYVLIRTYMGAYEYEAPATFEKWPATIPRRLRTNLEAQGEAITYSRDGGAVYTSSEGNPMPLTKISIDR